MGCYKALNLGYSFADFNWFLLTFFFFNICFLLLISLLCFLKDFFDFIFQLDYQFFLKVGYFNFIFWELFCICWLLHFYSILCLLHEYNIFSFCFMVESTIFCFPLFFAVSHFPMWPSWYLSRSVFFRQKAQCLMISAACPNDLGCVSYLRQGHWRRFAWQFTLRRLTVLTSERHCQMIRRVIKQMTDGIIWKLSLIPQSRIIQFNWLPAFWKQV